MNWFCCQNGCKFQLRMSDPLRTAEISHRPKVCRTFKCFFLRGLGARPRVLVGDGPPHRQRGVSTAHQPIGAGPMAGLAQPHPRLPSHPITTEAPGVHDAHAEFHWRRLSGFAKFHARNRDLVRWKGHVAQRISSPRAGQDIQSPPHNKALEGI